MIKAAMETDRKWNNIDRNNEFHIYYEFQQFYNQEPGGCTESH